MRFSEKSKKLNKLIYSIVALSLMLALLVTATHSWLSSNMSSNITSSDDYITVDPDAGLEINYGKDKNQGKINLNDVVPVDFRFRECSSADGRSIFFPVSEYNPKGQNASDENPDVQVVPPDGEFVDDVTTYDYIYREATVNDKNTKYISVNLSLYSKEKMPVYLRNTTIEDTNGGNIAKSIRIAFIENEPNGKSVVLDNISRQYGEEQHTYYPISSLQADGKVSSTGTITCSGIDDYTLESGNPLFTLEAGIEKFITVNIWLEGTDPDRTWDKVTGDALNGLDGLDIHVMFSTSKENMKRFYFVDHTLEKWVADKDCFIFATDQNGKNLYPTKSDSYDSDHTWVVDIPESVTSLRFTRKDPSNPDQASWNYWDAGELGDCTTYNAFAHNTGMWDDHFEPETITVFDGTSAGYLFRAALNDLNAVYQGPATLHLVYKATDGNGNTIEFNHKLSYQGEYNQWQVIIPSGITDIEYRQYYYNFDNEEFDPEGYFESYETTRTDEKYCTIIDDPDFNFHTFWSNELMYIDAHSNGNFSDGQTLAGYFYNENYEFWNAFSAKTADGKYKAAVPPSDFSDVNLNNPDVTTIYFTDDKGMNTPYVYYWGGSDGVDWPGIPMDYAYTNSYGQKIYKADVPNDVANLIFNNGSNQNQSADISLSNITLYDGIGFYLNDSKQFGGTYTADPGVVIVRHAAWVPEEESYAMFWDWGYVYNQVERQYERYGDNNLFTINGYNSNNELTGTWSKYN